MANRKKAEAFILEYMEKILPGSGNVKLYKDFFATMSDVEFDVYMKDLESGDKYLTMTIPSFSEHKVSIERNLQVADELGHNFFPKIWIGRNGDIPEHKSNVRFMVVDLPLRRASQLLIKKISVPDDNKTVDTLTGQPTGASKGAKISYSELQICAGIGLEKTMLELMKYRGGDLKGNVALNGMIAKYGKANLTALAPYASGVESTATLKTVLTAMHLKTTV
jgi:hypothetical protein